jgi:hypothetical protein
MSRKGRRVGERNRRRTEFMNQVRQELGGADLPILVGADKDALIGPKKISDTLVEYAEPLVVLLPDQHNASDMESALKLAADVWNAASRRGVLGVLFSKVELWLARRMIARHLHTRRHQATALVDLLLERRRSAFKDVPYRFGPISVRDTGGMHFQIMATALIPMTSEKKDHPG